MTDYKLVPVEPTPEMVEAAEDAYMPFGDMELAIRMAILAAPVVQGEPEYGSTPQYINNAIDNLAHANYELSYGGYQERTRDVELIRAYVARAPQPAEQQPAPGVAGLVEALRSILGWRELHSGNEFPVERIEEIAREALAAHRKGGGHV